MKPARAPLMTATEILRSSGSFRFSLIHSESSTFCWMILAVSFLLEESPLGSMTSKTVWQREHFSLLLPLTLSSGISYLALHWGHSITMVKLYHYKKKLVNRDENFVADLQVHL